MVATRLATSGILAEITAGRLPRLRQAPQPVERQLAIAGQPEPGADEPQSERFTHAVDASGVGSLRARCRAQVPAMRVALQGPRPLIVQVKVELGVHDNRLTVERTAAVLRGKKGEGRFALAENGGRDRCRSCTTNEEVLRGSLPSMRRCGPPSGGEMSTVSRWA
jgi:hypothetical protein